MSNAMREHLIGYLLDAVEPDERALVEQHLQQDEALRREVELLRTSLHPLSLDAAHHEPPAGLARRCCEYVFSRTEVMPAALSPAAAVPGGTGRRWSWLDVSVAGAIAAAVGFLLVPAIYQSHLQSQLLGCQKNLQDVGAALASYSDRHDGYYPATSPNKPLNAAALVSQGYLPSRAVVCPSTSQAGGTPGQVLDPEQQVLPNDELEKVLTRLSNYGYTLGYLDGDKGALQQNRHRKDFALSSDMPGNGSTNSPNHGGNGQNVLFEDGHVKYLNTSKVESTGDDIFRNDKGEIAPGLSPNDAVIVPNEDQSK